MTTGSLFNFVQASGQTGPIVQFKDGTTATVAAISATGVVTSASIITTASAPASNAAGVAGQMVFTDTYTYRCFASGDWRRVAVTYSGGY